MSTGRQVIIGDCHGCAGELHQLLRDLHLGRNDLLVTAGDLTDKGPDSAGVIRRLAAQSRRTPVVSVLGNHDLKHLALWKTGLMDTGREPEDPLYHSLSPQERAFYASSVLYFALPKRNALVVHAGIPRWMRHLPHPDPFIRGRLTHVGRMLLYLRYEEVRAGPGATKQRFWAEHYNGRFGEVFFGHTSFPYERHRHVFPHAFGVDYGCVVGGKLGAVVLTGERREVLTVDAARRYFAAGACGAGNPVFTAHPLEPLYAAA